MTNQLCIPFLLKFKLNQIHVLPFRVVKLAVKFM